MDEKDESDFAAVEIDAAVVVYALTEHLIAVRTALNKIGIEVE